jgi:hypothetical protein
VEGPDDGTLVKRELQMIIALRHNDPRHGFNNPFRALDCAPSPKCQKCMPPLDPQQRIQAVNWVSRTPTEASNNPKRLVGQRGW